MSGITTTHSLYDFLAASSIGKLNPVLGSNVVTLHTRSTIRDAVKQLAAHRITSAPVVDSQGFVHGILDVLDLVLHVLANVSAPSRGMAWCTVSQLDGPDHARCILSTIAILSGAVSMYMDIRSDSQSPRRCCS